MPVTYKTMKELVSTYSQLRDSIYQLLAKDFEVEEGYLELLDVFTGHPAFGDSAIVKYSGNNKMFHAPFSETDDGIRIAQVDNWKEIVQKYEFVQANVPASVATVQTENISELAVVSIEENVPNSPLILRMRIIEQGFGNKRDNHYYSKELLESSAQQFNGVKMYVTEHRQNEVNVRNEVAQILEAKYDADKRGIVARIGVFDESFANNVRNREKLGVLGSLHCSINAQGTVHDTLFEIGDRSGRKVKEFTKVNTVDFVSQPGAGGQALSIE